MIWVLKRFVFALPPSRLTPDAFRVRIGIHIQLGTMLCELTMASPTQCKFVKVLKVLHSRCVPGHLWLEHAILIRSCWHLVLEVNPFHQYADYIHRWAVLLWANPRYCMEELSKDKRQSYETGEWQEILMQDSWCWGRTLFHPRQNLTIMLLIIQQDVLL